MIGKIKKVGGDLLFHAITHANVHDAIALLEENEAEVNTVNINGQTPLHVSIIIIIKINVANKILSNCSSFL